MPGKLLSQINYLFSLVANYRNFPAVISYRLFHTPLTRVSLRNGLVISGNPASEVLSISYEIFYQHVYTPDHLSVGSGDVVVDIGGHIGTFTLFALHHGARRVYTYEPVPENFRLLQANLMANHYTNGVASCVAVSDKQRMEKLYLYDVDAGNTLKRASEYRTQRYITVPAVTFSQIITKNKLKKIDFLKIDCEGSEGDIIRSTPDRLLKIARKIAIEYHDNVSSLDHLQIEKKLKKLGFRTQVRSDSSPFGYLYAWQEDKKV